MSFLAPDFDVYTFSLSLFLAFMDFLLQLAIETSYYDRTFWFRPFTQLPLSLNILFIHFFVNFLFFLLFLSFCLIFFFFSSAVFYSYFLFFVLLFFLPFFLFSFITSPSLTFFVSPFPSAFTSLRITRQVIHGRGNTHRRTRIHTYIYICARVCMNHDE